MIKLENECQMVLYPQTLKPIRVRITSNRRGKGKMIAHLALNKASQHLRQQRTSRGCPHSQANCPPLGCLRCSLCSHMIGRLGWGSSLPVQCSWFNLLCSWEPTDFRAQPRFFYKSKKCTNCHRQCIIVYQIHTFDSHGIAHNQPWLLLKFLIDHRPQLFLG